MKKIIALTACVMLFTSNLAGAEALTTGEISDASVSIFGDITADAAGSTSATLIGKLSKGVKLGVAFSSTAYAVTSKHDSGITEYGTAYDATAIYKKDVGTADLSAPSASSITAFETGWTAM